MPRRMRVWYNIRRLPLSRGVVAAQGFLITLLSVRVFFSPQPLNPDFRPILLGSDEIGVFSSVGFGEVWVGVVVYTKIHTKST